MTSLTIGAGLVINDWTPKNLVFPLGGKTLFTIKEDGSIERGEGFTTEDEMSLHFWAMIEKLGAGSERERRAGVHLHSTAKSMGWKDDGEGAQEFLLRRCREVALEDSGVPPGWQIVPKQPTDEMLDSSAISRIAAIGVYSNMLKAAPPPPEA